MLLAIGVLWDRDGGGILAEYHQGLQSSLFFIAASPFTSSVLTVEGPHGIDVTVE